MSVRSSTITIVDFGREMARGRIAYDEKRYEEALQICGQALKTSNHDLTKTFIVLDLKCSVLIKSNKLATALDVAKSMIRIDKCNARGYCRAASIERLRGDLVTAQKYLQHGKSRAVETDTSYPQLLKQLSSVQEEHALHTVRLKPADPMNVLPLEILQMILSYLDYSNIVTILRVAKSWKRVLYRLEPLTTTMDFRASQKQVSNVALKAAIDRLLFPYIIAIHDFSPHAAKTVSYKLGQWKKYAALEHLSINSPKVTVPIQCYKRLRTISTGLLTEIDIGTVFQVLSSCEMLVEATFKRVKSGPIGEQSMRENLQVLELGNQFDLSAFSIPPDCFTYLPNLRKVTINGAACSRNPSWNLSQNKHLQKLDTYASVIRVIMLPGSLKQWFWDGTEVGQFRYTNDSSSEALINLDAICLSGDNTMDVLKHLYRCQVQPGQLKKVGLHNRQSTILLESGEPCLQIIAGVRELSFESECLQDHDFPAFMRRFPNIEYLQLAAPRITGAFIADLLKSSDIQIQKLILKDCRNVSVDTIDWARQRGVKVEVHLGKVEVRGGRRLREGWF